MTPYLIGKVGKSGRSRRWLPCS